MAHVTSTDVRVKMYRYWRDARAAIGEPPRSTLPVMNETRRVRVVIATAMIVTIVAIGVTSGAILRASRFQALQLLANQALQEVLRLSNNTFKILYSSRNLGDDFTEWQEQLQSTLTGIEQLYSHPQVDQLDQWSRRELRQFSSLITITTNGFTDGRRRLEWVFEAAPTSMMSMVNLSDTITALQSGHGSLPDSETQGTQEQLVFRLQQAFFQIEAANEGLEFFVTSTLDELTGSIAYATTQAIRVTIMTGLGLSLILLVSILLAMSITLRALTRANLLLESRVADRTHSLQQILDAADEGFFSFGPDLIIHPEISLECERIFGQNISRTRADQVLFGDPERRQRFAEAMDLVFTGAADPPVVFDVVDSTLNRNDRWITIKFRMISSTKVLCAIRDVTEKRKLEAEVADQQEKREMLLRIATDRTHFLSLDHDAKAIFEWLQTLTAHGEFRAQEEELPSLIRKIHTHKSNAAFFRMNMSAAALHDLETALEDAYVMQDSSGVVHAIGHVREAWTKELNFVRESLGEEFILNGTYHQVEGEAVRRLLHHAIKHHGTDSVLVEGLDSLVRVPITALFQKLADLVRVMAASRGKEVEISIEDRGVHVHERTYEVFSGVLNHIVRNMVDHGIELPRRRSAIGKPSAGLISFRAESIGRSIRVVASDDGAGIDVEEVLARARARGLTPDKGPITRKDVLRLVFSDGVSTAAATTATSGRGVGLPAVRQLIRKYKGTVGITTHRGRGTTIILTLPNHIL